MTLREKRPKWFKLLLLNRQRHRFGLTLPFMVGALQAPPGKELSAEAARAELRDLLLAMREETPISHVIRISECDRLRQPVAAPILSMFRLPDDVPLVSPYTGRAALYSSIQYVPASRSFDELVDSLWALNGTVLSQGLYSFRRGEFVSFDGDDFEFLNAADLIPDDAEDEM
jgi:hypothetical protein